MKGKLCAWRAPDGHTLEHGRISQPYAERFFHAPIIEPPRFGHERKQRRWDRSLGVGARYTRRPCEAEPICDKIEVIAHLQLAVVVRVENAGRCIPLE